MTGRSRTDKARPATTAPTYTAAPPEAGAVREWVVGGYIFLAGPGGRGAASFHHRRLGRRPRARHWCAAGASCRCWRPCGAVLLIYDLHTPKRFYNMLRIVQAHLADVDRHLDPDGFLAGSACSPHGLRSEPLSGRVAAPDGAGDAVPAAVAGAGLATYTAVPACQPPAHLFWAAAPRSLAVRFGASSVAAVWPPWHGPSAGFDSAPRRPPPGPRSSLPRSSSSLQHISSGDRVTARRASAPQPDACGPGPAVSMGFSGRSRGCGFPCPSHCTSPAPAFVRAAGAARLDRDPARRPLPAHRRALEPRRRCAPTRRFLSFRAATRSTAPLELPGSYSDQPDRYLGHLRRR